MLQLLILVRVVLGQFADVEGEFGAFFVHLLNGPHFSESVNQAFRPKELLLWPESLRVRPVTRTGLLGCHDVFHGVVGSKRHPD